MILCSYQKITQNDINNMINNLDLDYLKNLKNVEIKAINSIKLLEEWIQEHDLIKKLETDTLIYVNREQLSFNYQFLNYLHNIFIYNPSFSGNLNNTKDFTTLGGFKLNLDLRSFLDNYRNSFMQKINTWNKIYDFLCRYFDLYFSYLNEIEIQKINYILFFIKTYTLELFKKELEIGNISEMEIFRTETEILDIKSGILQQKLKIKNIKEKFFLMGGDLKKQKLFTLNVNSIFSEKPYLLKFYQTFFKEFIDTSKLKGDDLFYITPNILKERTDNIRYFDFFKANISFFETDWTQANPNLNVSIDPLNIFRNIFDSYNSNVNEIFKFNIERSRREFKEIIDFIDVLKKNSKEIENHLSFMMTELEKSKSNLISQNINKHKMLSEIEGVLKVYKDFFIYYIRIASDKFLKLDALFLSIFLYNKILNNSVKKKTRKSKKNKKISNTIDKLKNLKIMHEYKNPFKKIN
jgi:hypothetical protein